MRAGRLEVRPRLVVVAASDLEIGAHEEQVVRVVGGDGAQCGSTDAIRFVPVAARDQRLDPVGDERRLVDAVEAQLHECRLRQLGRLLGTAEHRQHVGEMGVRSVERDRIAASLGELQGQPELREALVAAAEVGEVDAEHGERAELCAPRADRTCNRERLLADR